METTDSEYQLDSVFDAERFTGVKAATWRKYIYQRKVPSVKIGRAIRIPRSAIVAMVKQGWREAVALEGNDERSSR